MSPVCFPGRNRGGVTLQQVEVRTAVGKGPGSKKAEDRLKGAEMCGKEQEGGSRDSPALPEPQCQTCQKHQGHYHRQEDQAHGVRLFCGFGAQRVSFPIHPGLNCTSLVLCFCHLLPHQPPFLFCLISPQRWTLHPTLCILPYLWDLHPQFFHLLDY